MQVRKFQNKCKMYWVVCVSSASSGPSEQPLKKPQEKPSMNSSTSWLLERQKYVRCLNWTLTTHTKPTSSTQSCQKNQTISNTSTAKRNKPSKTGVRLCPPSSYLKESPTMICWFQLSTASVTISSSTKILKTKCTSFSVAQLEQVNQSKFSTNSTTTTTTKHTLS